MTPEQLDEERLKDAQSYRKKHSAMTPEQQEEDKLCHKEYCDAMTQDEWEEESLKISPDSKTIVAP